MYKTQGFLDDLITNICPIYSNVDVVIIVFAAETHVTSRKYENKTTSTTNLGHYMGCLWQTTLRICLSVVIVRYGS